MVTKYVLASNKGICEFCGQPIEMHEPVTFVKVVGEDWDEDADDARICHQECFYLASGGEE